jgi:nitrogen regulatory protein PII
MKLFVIILNHVEYLEDLLSALLEIGISGATILDSTGMGRVLTTQIPIFAGLRDAFPNATPVNKTILVVVNEDQIDDVEIVLEEVCGDFEEQGVGIYFCVPLDFVKGLRRGY